MGLLDQRVAIVTGAARGIGKATARLLAAEGASLVVNDNGAHRDGTGSDPAALDRLVEDLEREGARVVAHRGDVADPATGPALVKQALTSFKRLDVLVTCAGILRDRTLLKLPEEDFRALLDVDLVGTFHCLKAAALQMKQQGSGRIVTCTGIAGLLGNYAQANYAAAKAGVFALTRTASIELQRHGVTVNSVAPVAKTRMTEDLPMFEKLETLTVEHVAPAILFFASDLSADVSGTALAVAGGKLSTYRLTESAGRFKDDAGGVWTAREIAEQWALISK